jgi:hypothetical protein
MNINQINAILHKARTPRFPNTDQLEALPVLAQGHVHDLHIDTGIYRVWLSRCSIEDGEPFRNTAYIEIKNANHLWQDLGYYDADSPPDEMIGLDPADLADSFDETL